MSSQQYTRKTVTLSQEQSAVLDGLTGWTDTGKQINYTKKDGTPGEFYKKYAEKPIDESTLEACNILAELGLGLYDKADSFSGVYRYTINKNTLEKELIKKGTYTPRSTTTSTIPSKSNVNWDEVNKKREERDKKFDVKHDESMQRMDDLTFMLKEVGDIISRNTESNNRIAKTQEDANRLKQIELGETKTN